MLRSMMSKVIKVRLALWFAELALPSGSELNARFGSALLGVMAAVAGGVLAACAVAAAIAGGFYLLFQHGSLTDLQSLLATIFTTLLFITGLLLLGIQLLRNAFSVTGTGNRPRAQMDKNTMQELVNGFMEGLLVGSPSAADARKRARRKSF